MAAMNPPDDESNHAEDPKAAQPGDPWADAARQAAEHRARTRSRKELADEVDPDSTPVRRLSDRLGATPEQETPRGAADKTTAQSEEEPEERTRAVDPWVAASRRAALRNAAASDATREEPEERTRRVDPYVAVSRRVALRQASETTTDEASAAHDADPAPVHEPVQEPVAITDASAEAFLTRRSTPEWRARRRDRWWGIAATPNTAIVVDGDHVFVDGTEVAPVAGLEAPAALGIYAVAHQARQLGREVRATGHDDHGHTYLGVAPNGQVRVVKSPSSISLRRVLIASSVALLVLLVALTVLTAVI